MFQFLRAIGLQPIEWSQAVALTGQPAPFVGEVLEAAFSHAQAVVVLLTGDDEARLRSEFLGEDEPDSEKTLTQQARPNVLFEAGMAFGRSPNRTVLVQLGNLRPFSDIAGRHVIRMNNSTVGRQELAQRLAVAGCHTNLTGTDWHHIGDFEAAIRPHLPSSPLTVHRRSSTAINFWLPTTHKDIRIGLFTPQDKATVPTTPIESSGCVVGLP